MTFRSTSLRGSVALGVFALVVVAAVAGTAAARPTATAATATTHRQTANPYHLIHPGTLTAGLALQFKPLMYLDKNGKPAGYDVAVLNVLAKQMHVKLVIKNIDFNGLIPGVVAKKFDMVDGLTATPERAKSVTFSRPYIPYAQILAARTGNTTPATISAWNTSSKTITSLQGSTAEQQVKKTFPQATSHAFPDQNSAFLEVATGRAHAIVVEDYQLAQFNKSFGNKLKEVAFKKPLHVEYGSYSVHHGNTAFARYLNRFICTQQTNGTLAKLYKQTIGAPLPQMPRC